MVAILWNDIINKQLEMACLHRRWWSINSSITYTPWLTHWWYCHKLFWYILNIKIEILCTRLHEVCVTQVSMCIDRMFSHHSIICSNEEGIFLLYRTQHHGCFRHWIAHPSKRWHFYLSTQNYKCDEDKKRKYAHILCIKEITSVYIF